MTARERDEPAIPADGRLLAVDWGERRIGLAVSDPSQTIAQPLATLTRRSGKRFPMQQLREHIDRETPVAIVVGLPLAASGYEGAAAKAARAAGTLIAAKTGLPVVYVDERMTTARALAIKHEMGGRGRDRDVIDQVAAAVVLQAFINRRRS
jgi:putative Holliday junction resolvase